MTVTWARRVLASLASAVLVAILAHVAAVLPFFIISQLSPTVLPAASEYFVLASLFTFLLLFIGGMLGGLTSWRWALPTGIIVGIVAPVIGTMLSHVQQGGQLTGEVFGLLIGTLVGTNAIYALAVFIATPTLGRAVYKATVGFREAPRAAERRIAIVRMPAKNLAQGIAAAPAEIDIERADEQWDAYTAAFEEHGWTTTEAPSADQLADSVFVEDTVVLFDELAVLTRPALDTRRGEVDGVEETVAGLGLTVERIMAPGTLEGGDVLKVGDTVYVGRSARTNAEGIRQLRRIVAPYGYSVVGVPVTKALHLKTIVTALPDGTFIGDPDLIDEPGLFPGFLAARETVGAPVIVLSDDTLLLSASAPKTAELLEDLGYTVVSVDISEFEKLDGGVTCMSVRVR
ncbi:dimethylargininase [Paramicrobacterium humi]|uniref:Dimethylargininase n=1 Tax=Paramicrobacterium humi TaxID=640635 RepID=A0A1H4IZH2_9MICO|nr:dimethylargininase [Microbacterium humi]SEB38712.1 dimethylargininase [Microbacterium humi]